MSENHLSIDQIFAPVPRSIEDCLNVIAPLIPTQGPIKEFIHHNTLHSFQHLAFGCAIAQNRWLHGAEINNLLSSAAEAAWYEKLDSACDGIAVLRFGIRHQRSQSLNYKLDEDLLPILIKLTASYYDQGLAIWPHPSQKLETETFWDATSNLAKSTMIPLIPLNGKTAKELLNHSAEEAIDKALTLLCDDLRRTRYLAEILALLPGWAGFVREVEINPSQLTHQRKSRLVDWLAVCLVIEVGLLEKNTQYLQDKNGKEKILGDTKSIAPDNDIFESAGDILEKSLTAKEWQIYENILHQVKERSGDRSDSNVKNNAINTAWQVITCIDDRNFSLRSFIEEEWPESQTFGAAGFFAVDTMIQDAAHGTPVKHCPAPVTPKHVLTAQRPGAKPKSWRIWEHETASILRSWLAPQVMGIPSALKLLVGTMAPEWIERTRLHKDDVNVKIDPFFKHIIQDDIRHGYTIDEAATRIGNLLKTIGLTTGIAKYVAVVGHGSSSSNNPYFAAYDCGACSGRPGAFNALAFCLMANDLRVRDALVQRGIRIPTESVFVPFLHDTATDSIIPVGDPDLFRQHEADISLFLEKLNRALSKNAQLRCRQFELTGKHLTPSEATRHVARRAVAWYEPRPEYNHATNIACIVGRRKLTRSLESSRAIFLQSYDPDLDPEGSLLTGVLGAVIPVCGGINLEYLFSRIDPEFYGAGSKLPHNVTGLNGVMTGIESDLRTGLPKQMTEIHEPLRLLIVVEQEPNLILKSLENLPHLRSWIENRWVWLVSHHPTSMQQLVYHCGTFHPKEKAYAI